MDKNSIVRLALDIRHGTVPAEYANQGNPSDVLRKALIEANGGSSTFNYKTLRRNKTEIFEIIEEIVPVLTQEGLQGDEFWNNLVEDRNIAAGDQNDFTAEDNTLFVVAEMADGIATPRRQRIGEKTTVTVPTSVHGIRIYEEFARFMAGRIDWNELVDRVAKSFTAKLREDVFAVFKGITDNTPGLNNTYVKSGTYNEETLANIIEHVEAATGKTATVYGTKAALRKAKPSVDASDAKNEYYAAGYYGKVAGASAVFIKNRHKVGTDEFIIPDNKLWIIAGGDKPIKYVTEGEAFVMEKDGTTNADMTLEYTYIEKYGIGLLVNQKLGVYTLA